jgi:hypothetical protein
VKKRSQFWERSLTIYAISVTRILATQLIRVSLIFDLLRSFLSLAGSLVRSFLGRVFHGMAAFLCRVLGTSSGIFRGILGFVPGILHILFRALLRCGSKGRTREGNRQKEHRTVFS